MPSVPQQDQGWTLLQKAFGSSIPTEQMEKSRLLPGGVPAPSLFRPQAVPGAGGFSVPAKPSARGTCGNCFMRLPGTQDPLWGIQGGASLLVVAGVFPANMAFAKVCDPTCVGGGGGLPRPRSKPAANLCKTLGPGSIGASKISRSLEGGLPPGGPLIAPGPGPGGKGCPKPGG